MTDEPDYDLATLSHSAALALQRHHGDAQAAAAALTDALARKHPNEFRLDAVPDPFRSSVEMFTAMHSTCGLCAQDFQIKATCRDRLSEDTTSRPVVGR
jgi:hypothetical protein